MTRHMNEETVDGDCAKGILNAIQRLREAVEFCEKLGLEVRLLSDDKGRTITALVSRHYPVKEEEIT